MHDVAAAHDEHAFVAQRPQFFGERPMPGGGLQDVQAKLDDRYVGFGIEVAQHRPSAVVQAAVGVGMQLVSRQQFADARGEFRCARCRVLCLIQRFGEAVEVVEDGVVRAAHDAQVAANPVRRNHQDGLRFGDGGGGLQEGAVVAAGGVDGVHRAAVAEEDGGEGHGGSGFFRGFLPSVASRRRGFARGRRRRRSSGSAIRFRARV